MTNYTEYHEYLLKRSFLGKIYRNLLLYPKLIKYCSGRVLDVGCGIGDFLTFCDGRIDAHGVDINENNVKFCQQKGFKSAVINNGIIPFENGFFETIILDNVIEHIDEPSQLLSEFERITAKGATVIVGVPCLKGFNSDPDHKVFYRWENLVEVFVSFGFSPVNSFYMPVNTPVLGKILRQHALYVIFERN
ncbi:class I SAM-dependent methyltransferase [Aliamphritea ceti]|uniref:class I SAM-dependent methyltransferase n=1 Tax=Aliamphritea ceti TaxID=1524258 RepID=UPI0021C2F81B|nr:methionine biosynthesis protein MetW [Aliamphritea ceti]